MKKITMKSSDSGSVGVCTGNSGFAGSVTRKVLVDFGLPDGILGVPDRDN